jgi:hypothetical protein
VDRTEIERLLEQLNAEREALQSRLTIVEKATDSLQALLEMSPASTGWSSVAGSGAGHVDLAPVREEQQVTPVPQPPAEETPKGMRAAQLILQSDTSRFWNVREVSDEEIRRKWAEPRPRGAKGNPPARAALERLRTQYPRNIKVIGSPFLAYKWISDPSPTLNGAGPSASDAEEVS